MYYDVTGTLRFRFALYVPKTMFIFSIYSPPVAGTFYNVYGFRSGIFFEFGKTKRKLSNSNRNLRKLTRGRGKGCVGYDTFPSTAYFS